MTKFTYKKYIIHLYYKYKNPLWTGKLTIWSVLRNNKKIAHFVSNLDWSKKKFLIYIKKEIDLYDKQESVSATVV